MALKGFVIALSLCAVEYLRFLPSQCYYTTSLNLHSQCMKSHCTDGEDCNIHQI